ncbi:hypothetical protein [Segetibacter sp. 3557_3]|uniref:hypothetical protein n=1 Tax=Segetibacter sp. 3557_3 TaxID=2547429 RepID=UPI001A9E3AA0|nr:hypothetical protein [Segetibacter sp. 3557_3]
MDNLSPNIFVAGMKQTIGVYKQLGFGVVTTLPKQGDILGNDELRNRTFLFQTFESLGNDLPTISRQTGGSLLLYIQTTEIGKFFDQIKHGLKVVEGHKNILRCDRNFQ